MGGRVFGIRMALRFVQIFSQKEALLGYLALRDTFASFLPVSNVRC